MILYKETEMIKSENHGIAGKRSREIKVFYMSILPDLKMKRFQRSVFLGDNKFSVRKLVSHTNIEICM